MREATTRGPSIDVTEFERRLRGSDARTKRASDPLTELARLLQSEDPASAADPYRSIFSAGQPRERASGHQEPGAPPIVQARQAASRPEPFAPSIPQARRAPSRPEPFAPSIPQARQAAPGRPEPIPPSQAAPTAGRRNDFAADLRGSLDASLPAGGWAAPDHHAAEREPTEYESPVEAGWSSYDETQAFLDYGGEQADEPEAYAAAASESRGRKFGLRPWQAVAVIAVIGTASVGWGLAHRSGVVGPREIATISAPEGPVKVQPKPEVEGDAAPSNAAAVLDRTESAPVSKVVSHEEQPVDAAAASRAVSLGSGPVDAPHEASAPSANAGPGSLLAPEPKKVKTVSVRPDGTIVTNDSVPAAVTEPAPAAPGAGADGARVDAPTRGVTPKTPAKPPTTPRAAQPTPRAAPPKTAAVENPGANDEAAGNEPAPPSATGDGGGAYAVQFGAAGSEAEARQLLQKIAGQFSSQLGGRRLGYHRAKVDGKTVYRVRVGGMDKDAAVGICEKVKSAGGNCFVANN